MSTTCDSLQDTEDPSPAVPRPPDGGYGWVCVAACFAINCFTWGVVASYGVFLGYYLENGIYLTATPTDFAFIGGLNFSVAMLASPAVTSQNLAVTVLVRRNPFGIHLPMLIGVGLQTAGFIIVSFATLGLGVGFTYIPSIAVLSQWFRRRRSLANGISAAGSGIGGLMFSFLVRAAISNVSLAWSLRITGLVSGFMNILATVAIRSRNHIIQPKQHPFDMDLFCRYDVMLVLAWAFVSMLGYITLLFSMSNFASSIGLGESQSANVTAFLNLGIALGRPFIGIISDYFGRIQTAGFITLLCALSVFVIWIPAISYGITIFFVIVNGAILGVFWVTIGPICTEVVGLGELPSMLSLAWLVIVLPTTCKFGPVLYLKGDSHVIALILRPGLGNEFLYPQIFAGLAYLIASIISLELWRVRRRSTVVEYASSQGAPEGETSVALTARQNP
ncbi:MFS general substrate transporter [Cadophora sp. DSE1049]|nr:MFS general substrate transporter [Cadophora sp. DSE1049]